MKSYLKRNPLLIIFVVSNVITTSLTIYVHRAMPEYTVIAVGFMIITAMYILLGVKEPRKSTFDDEMLRKLKRGDTVKIVKDGDVTKFVHIGDGEFTRLKDEE